MPIAAILGMVLQVVQAGFSLADIVGKVKDMESKGATEQQIHDYLKNLAHATQGDLEKA